MFSGFSHSVKGASHEIKGIVCQDSSAYYAGEDYAVAVVADGHGSKKHFRSNVGSRLAVESTLATVRRFFANPEEFKSQFPSNYKMITRNIQRQVISDWNFAVTAHYTDNPVTAEEKSDFTPEEFAKIPVESYYGTTLVAVIACDEFTFGFQIGDGSLIGVFEDGSTEMLIDYEESNPANITASICNANAASMFGSFYIGDRKALALYVSTDGLYTSFGSDNDFLNYHTIITSQLSEADNFEASVIKNLKVRSNYGTQDDISLAFVYNRELISSRQGILNTAIAKNKKK
ncbi:MAG: protein phosphatase 2C domain-containing protein [Ruminococcus flavefaciens]|nr:protein phosphatase 2C domain-containing protein [Ruminococcus flavefaciens]MCM1229881.1 protein phosphatase 2C domain-containing protein [Ruminococcus flavefaciens]